MLRRVVPIVAWGTLLLAAPASAGPIVTCPAGQTWDPDVRTCLLVVSAPSSPGGALPAPQQASDSLGGEVSACMARSFGQSKPVPCVTDSGWWSDATQCYVQLLDPQPPQSDSIWQGHTDGAIYTCRVGSGGMSAPFAAFWSASMPAGPAAPVDPAVVAQTIVSQMELRAFDIGMVPEDRPGSMGIVGLPMWLWVQNPSEQTFGPMERSASLGSVTVTATAQVQRIVWDMGNGDAVTCTSSGTPFADGRGGQSSPDCGYTYSRQGTYPIQATAYWNVAWASNTGVTGNIPLEFTSTRQVVVGEIQVVRR